MMELAYIICKNCSNKPEGKYCSNCGQKTSRNRLTWKALFHYILHALLHLDEGFFYTIKELMSRPGHTIRKYLQGKRVKHYNPLVMLVLLAGFASYLYVHFHIQTIRGAVKLDKVEAGNAMIAHKFFAARNIFFCLVCGIGDYLFFMERNILFRKCCFQIFLFFVASRFCSYCMFRYLLQEITLILIFMSGLLLWALYLHILLLPDTNFIWQKEIPA